MWYAALLRFIRRRLVLAIIFFLSLTYCIISLMGKGGPLSLEVDDFEVKRQQPLIWRTNEDLPPVNSVDNGGNNAINTPDKNSTNEIHLKISKCRNSIQGKVLLVDDHGYLCYRSDLLISGCCDREAESTKLYNCDTCNDHECCTIYENCVSCCLNPNKKELLEKVLENASGRQKAVFATVKDHFELCLAKCRTDSHSVQNENKYRNPKWKHCYGLTRAHESQVLTNEDGDNNNNNNIGNIMN